MKVPGNHRFNERLSPTVKNRKHQTLQILSNLKHNHCKATDTILDDLGFDSNDFDEVCETLFQQLIDEGVLEECGCCGGYHREDFVSDCRNDDERFPRW